jgi:O-antigen ligase
VIQSIIGLLQFFSQTSLGLYRLGESHLGPTVVGAAKIIVNNQAFIRGYGTFPHPNLLAVLLIVSILISIYSFLNSTWKNQIWWGIAIFVNILGLTVTFSRAAFLALAIGLIIFFGILGKILFLDFMEKIKFSNSRFSTSSNNTYDQDAIKNNLIMVIVIVIVSSAFSFLLFRPYLISRAVVKDNTLSERILFNQIGLNMIKHNPVFGVGAGESVLHMEQYSTVKLEPWQKQPIHNYFLLSAAELGIPGALILIWILISHFFLILNLNILKLFRNWKLEIRNLQLGLSQLTTLTLLFSFLILMMFDHYFYTLQQTQLLLWITLGMIAAQTKIPK